MNTFFPAEDSTMEAKYLCTNLILFERNYMPTQKALNDSLVNQKMQRMHSKVLISKTHAMGRQF